MKKLLLILLLATSCSKEEICETTAKIYEHGPSNTQLIYEGNLNDFRYSSLTQGQNYAFIIYYCDGSTDKYTMTY